MVCMEWLSESEEKRSCAAEVPEREAPDAASEARSAENRAARTRCRSVTMERSSARTSCRNQIQRTCIELEEEFNEHV